MFRKSYLLIPIVQLLLVCMTSTAGAAIVHWTGNLNTAFENPNNWDIGTVPGLDDDAHIAPAVGKPAPNFTTTATNAQPIVLVSVGYSSTSGTMNMSSGTLTCNCAFVGTKVGKSGATATATMTGGTIRLTGKHNVSGAWICNQGYLQWPRSTAGGNILGTFTMSGGLVDVGALDLPNTDSTGTGIFNLNGGTLYVRPTNDADKASILSTEGGLFIGENRARDTSLNGKLNIAGGTLMVTGDVTGLITRYVDVNHVILPYPSDSNTLYHKYIVSDFDDRMDGKTVVTAAKTEIHQAWKPSPINGSKFVLRTPTLCWQAGLDADTHCVYFGTNAPVCQSDTCYTPGTLNLGQTYYWRVNEVNASGTTTGEIWTFTVEGGAKNPIPESGATDVETGPSKILRLEWTPSPYATLHNVCIGTDCFNAPDPCLDVTIDMGRTYYWKVNEVNGATTVQGDLWNFTSSNYLLIDDFESYSDTVGTTWSCPNGEITVLLSSICHGGTKAMEVRYDLNSSYDRVEGDLGSGQDWTSETTGTNTLSLWLRGTGNNDAIDSISVYLRDSGGDWSDKASVTLNSVLYNEEWVNVNIATSAFGDGPGNNFSLAAVQYVGIELDATTKGAVSGFIYVDDIRLYPSRCVPDKDITYSGKAATADITDDCTVNNNDLDVISEDWLEADSNPEPDGTLMDGTAVGNGPTWGTGKFSNGVVLDGVNDWVNVDDLTFPDFANKTIAMWFKTSALPAANQSFFLFGTSVQWRVNISVTTDSAGTPSRVQAAIGNEPTQTVFGNSGTISNATWYHVALTLSAPDSGDNVTGTLYLNGVAQTPSDVVTPSHYYDFLTGACIGSMNNGLQQYASATIDDFRIYGTVLTTSDIALLADNDIGTNPTATPQILYAFNEAAGTSAEQDGSIASVYHPVGYAEDQFARVYEPVEMSDAEIYSSEAAGSRKVNFKDYANLAKYWLYTIPNWP